MIKELFYKEALLLQFYDLKQSGPEIQAILDGYKTIQENFNTLNQSVNNLPLKVITQQKNANYKIDNIIENGIYYIETAALNVEDFELYFKTIPIDTDYIMIMHFQIMESSQSITYKSQILYTQNITQSLVAEPLYYQRGTDKSGKWSSFVNMYDQLKARVESVVKIQSWDEEVL